MYEIFEIVYLICVWGFLIIMPLRFILWIWNSMMGNYDKKDK